MDFVSDKNPTALLHLQEKGLPEFVKLAQVLNPDELTGLADAAFADPVTRELPIHTKAATWLSAAYYYGHREPDMAIEQTLQKAAKTWGIVEEVDAARQELAQMNKSAGVPEPQHALTVDFGGEMGRGVRHFYPINNYGEVIGSSFKLAADVSDNRIPIEFAREAAVNLLKAAKAHGVDETQIHDRLVKLGAQRLPDYDHALAIAETRAWAGVPEDGIQHYRDIVKAAAADTEDNLQKYIDLWLDLDSSHQIKYGSTILSPFEAFLAGPKEEDIQKLASQVVVIRDVMVPTAAFVAVNPERVQQVFKKESADLVAAAQKEAPTNAAAATTKVASLSGDEQKELLRLLLEVAA